MKPAALGIVLVLAGVAPVKAGFEQWSAEVEDDPFSKGQRVVVSYMSTIRSGIFIFCDSAKRTFSVRAIPGFAYDQRLESFAPEMSLAIDGSVILENLKAETGSVGDNLAAAEITLSANTASIFVDAFVKAKKQVAIQDGISDQPHLLRARGSTKAGGALATCLGRQADSQADETPQTFDVPVFRFSNESSHGDVFIVATDEKRAREIYRREFSDVASTPIVTEVSNVPANARILKDTP